MSFPRFSTPGGLSRRIYAAFLLAAVIPAAVARVIGANYRCQFRQTESALSMRSNRWQNADGLKQENQRKVAGQRSGFRGARSGHQQLPLQARPRGVAQGWRAALQAQLHADEPEAAQYRLASAAGAQPVAASPCRGVGPGALSGPRLTPACQRHSRDDGQLHTLITGGQSPRPYVGARGMATPGPHARKIPAFSALAAFGSRGTPAENSSCPTPCSPCWPPRSTPAPT